MITGERTILSRKLDAAVAAGILTEFQAFAIYRCCLYHEQIADVSLGSIWRDDILNLLAKG